MNAPICTVCLESGILCSACNAKLKSGAVTQADVDVSRFLHERSKDVRSLRDASVRRVVETNRVLLVICGKGDAAKIVGHEGLVVNALSKHFRKKVRIVEESGDDRALIRGMLLPAEVRGVNVLYTPRGEEYVVHVSKSSKLPLDRETFAGLCRVILKKSVKIVLE